MFVADDQRPLVDEPVGARLVGCRPGDRVTITAAARDPREVGFRSTADYEADGRGEIHPATQAPLSGTYEGVDPYGLWWSMHSEPIQDFAIGLAPVATTLQATLEGSPIAGARLERVRLRAGVRVLNLEGEGLVGVLFSPPDRPAPGIVVLGGSEGGLHWSGHLAALLASRGFAALALAYFGISSRPPHPVGVPCEYSVNAVHWLLERDEVASEQVGLIGSSRGAELALQIAALCPNVGAVVAYAPSSVRWTGFDPGRSAPRPAWTWRDAALPYLSLDQAMVDDLWSRSPVALGQAFVSALGDDRRVAEATIAVERIEGPVLLISGVDDAIWPSAPMADLTMERLTAHGHPYPDRHLCYPQAGHRAGHPPGLPAPGPLAVHPADRDTYVLGGTRAGNASSSADAWPKILRFLRHNLPQAAGPDAFDA
jgi:dienelactone hydrolase